MQTLNFSVSDSVVGCSRCSVQPTRRQQFIARAPTRTKRTHAVAAVQGETFGDNVRRVARQVQGALPLVGLLSRLTTPTGGIGNDDLSYPDFCRTVYEAGLERLNLACVDLERKYGKKGCGFRNVLYALWASREVGLVEPRAIIASCRRLRVTQDMEIECDRHEGGKQQTLAKYSYMDRPLGGPQDKADVAVDALATLMGIPDATPFDADDIEWVSAVIEDGTFFGAKEPREVVQQAVAQAIQGRGSRKYEF